MALLLNMKFGENFWSIIPKYQRVGAKIKYKERFHTLVIQDWLNIRSEIDWINILGLNVIHFWPLYLKVRTKLWIYSSKYFLSQIFAIETLHQIPQKRKRTLYQIQEAIFLIILLNIKSPSSIFNIDINTKKIKEIKKMSNNK